MISENPNIRQRAFASGEALAETDFSVISVAGEDRLGWLNSLFSQKLDDLNSGESREALSLDAQGRLQHILRIIGAETEVLIITGSSVVDELFDYLVKMKFRKQVEITKPELAVYASYGKPAEDVFFQDSWPDVAMGGFRYGAREIAHPVFLNITESLPAELIDLESIEPIRIYAGRPAETEIDEKSLPHELDYLTSAVHLQKGCYKGQEAVAKVHKLGHPPRRLTMLYLEDGTELPNAGDELFVGEKLVGKITIAGNHFEAGPIALALIKRNVDYDADLGLENGQGATQEVLVPQTAGSVSDIPKLPRLRLNNKP